MYGYDHPVDAGGNPGYWFAAHPGGEYRLCDNIKDGKKHYVPGNVTRLWVEDPTGRATKASHGHARKFYCSPCAKELFDLDPPNPFGRL